MRRRSGQNFEELLNKQWSILTRNQHHEIQSLYKKTEQQRGGGISFYDMINILRAIGLNVDQDKKDEINREITTKEIRVLDINTVLNQAAALKKEKQQNNYGDFAEENQYLDAFVALGGGADKGGYVRKSSLIETIKREFELTFDIESIIDGVQGDSLDYTAFCSIFQQEKERGDGRLASAASQRSLRSNESIRSLVIDEKDFQKFIAQYEAEENYM